MFGTLQSLADDHVMVEVADGVTLKVARGAIGSVVPPAAQDQAEPPSTEDEPGEAEAPEGR